MVGADPCKKLPIINCLHKDSLKFSDKKRVVLKVAAGFDLQKTAESSISLLMQVWDFQTVKPCTAFSCFRGRKITKCNIYSK